MEITGAAAAQCPMSIKTIEHINSDTISFVHAKYRSTVSKLTDKSDAK